MPGPEPSLRPGPEPATPPASTADAGARGWLREIRALGVAVYAARPDRAAHDVPIARHVDMPRSTSFPSGHAASASAFASGVAHELPAAGVPLQAVAALVAYSRVHTGVHYPIDVIAGAVLGGALAPLTAAALDRRRSS